ncbi:hypothetical protein [Agrobacterium sp. CG674]
MRKIKLMSDYGCWCLWDMDEPDNVNPDTLQISEGLKQQLHRWEHAFDKTLDPTDHTKIGFHDERRYNEFYDLGWKLFFQLKSELPGVEWWYRDRRYNELLDRMP